MALILLIDDEPRIRYLERTILESLGFEVVEAVNGRTAIEILRSNKQFALIMADIAMPDLDGFTLKSKLNKDPVLKSIPVLFVSAHTSHHYKNVGRIMGSIDYVEKPFDPKELANKVQAILDAEKARHHEPAALPGHTDDSEGRRKTKPLQGSDEDEFVLSNPRKTK